MKQPGIHEVWDALSKLYYPWILGETPPPPPPSPPTMSPPYSAGGVNHLTGRPYARRCKNRRKDDK